MASAPVGPPPSYSSSTSQPPSPPRSPPASTVLESRSFHHFTRERSHISHHATPSHPEASPDSSEEEDGQGPIYTSRNNRRASFSLNPGMSSTSVSTGAIIGTGAAGNGPGTGSGLRSRFVSGLKRLGDLRDSDGQRNPKFRTISTAPGQLCAGETETEADEPSRRLPTARIVLSSDPIIPPNTLQQRLTPLLFEFSRLLAIVPAVIGTLYNLYHVYLPPSSSPYPGRKPPERIDYFVSALWAILTGYQCLALTTGLLTRWQLYYPPLSTLIRLLALQGICWPATQLTLSLFEHKKRPVVVWALIGTTTCTSRSIQIWVTSNLWWETTRAASVDRAGCDSGGGARKESSVADGLVRSPGGYWRRWGGKWGGRRWDWKEVSIKCVLPAGIMYFVMAWGEQLRREWD